jgi:hypothetical protein
MARWIVFDETTAAELRSQLPEQAVFEAPGRTALEYALKAARAVVAVPAGDEATIAVFRRRRHNAVAQPRVSAPVGVSTVVRATGFLGLSDHAAEEEEAAAKKRWWQFWR